MLIYPNTTKQGTGEWLIDWSGQGTGPYEVWLTGDLLHTTTDESFTYSGISALSNADPYESTAPPIEIWDTSETGSPYNQLYPPYAFLQWRRIRQASYYLIEQYSGGAWSEVARVPEDGAQPYQQYETSSVSDNTTAQYRVSAYDAQGNTRVPVQFDFVVRCNPDPPSPTIVWNGTLNRVEVTFSV